MRAVNKVLSKKDDGLTTTRSTRLELAKERERENTQSKKLNHSNNSNS